MILAPTLTTWLPGILPDVYRDRTEITGFVPESYQNLPGKGTLTEKFTEMLPTQTRCYRIPYRVDTESVSNAR